MTMTNRRVVKTALATSDIEKLAEYFQGEAGLTVALRFVDNAERAFQRLAAMPKVGAFLGFDEVPYADIRRWHIEEFERLIILYRDQADSIQIVRVLHTSRDIAVLLREYPA